MKRIILLLLSATLAAQGVAGIGHRLVIKFS